VATRSPHFCNHGGCTVLTSDTYCAEHAPLHEWTDERDSSGARGYDSKWRKVRAKYLSRHPLCQRCEEQGRVVLADVVHHIKPLDEGGPRLDQLNLMSLCRDCHEIIHGRKVQV
jgi:5-methylcytosine-specific restriction enzyme A